MEISSADVFISDEFAILKLPHFFLFPYFL